MKLCGVGTAQAVITGGTPLKSQKWTLARIYLGLALVIKSE